MSEQNERELEFVKETERGYYLYRCLEPHGGYSWWCDDVPNGRLVLDEGLDDLFILREVLEHNGWLPLLVLKPNDERKKQNDY